MNCVSYDICVYNFWLCLCFFSGVLLNSRVTAACPVTTDLIMRVNVRTTTTKTKTTTTTTRTRLTMSSTRKPRNSCFFVLLIHLHKYILSLLFFLFGQVLVSASVWDSRELEFLGQIASFERRLRGTAPTPLVLPYPFRTSTWTRMGAERDKR